ncbi:hypothetical protein [Ruminiclostridium cellobioparum]|jgi:hypothetical protein|uniref:Uncharacterized protein n=1 Tax=Ruminiclostridium cellobioparum subsp. termitidis CT1112 TaxID=1195236 RepID=S0FL93_RUMCE|nr:hypothetical protein [Ruminiclostridium cellobioparum]EMS72980.1 hypothetical protein CTER_1060 [Ruminiclostridium cellobioparum subsp. termitidis CT1112]
MNTKNRKYARPSKRRTSSTVYESEDTEFTLSTTAAIGILGGTFLVGVAAGKLVDMCRKW